MSSSTPLNANSNGNALPLSEKTSEPATPDTLNTNNLSIPMNKGGQLYTLNEMFEVWDETEDAILSTKLDTQPRAYRAPEPNQIFHVDLIQNPDFQRLSLEDATININGGAERISATNGDSDFADRGVAANAPSQTPNIVPQQANDQKPVASALVAPQEIEWLYLDPSGNEQGPFNGELMQGWFNDGYLAPNLMVKRADDSAYITLRQFCESVSDFVQPFKVPLPAIISRIQQTQSPSQVSSLASQLPLQNSSIPVQSYRPLLNTSVNFGSQPLFTESPLTTASSFGQSNYQTFPSSIPSLLQQQIHQQHQPVLSRTSSNWGLENYSNPETPLSVNPVINAISQPANPVVQPTPLSPWTNGIHSQSRVNSPFVPPVDNSSDTVLSDFSSSVVTGILEDDDTTSKLDAQSLVPSSQAEVPAKPNPAFEKEPKAKPQVTKQAPIPQPRAKEDVQPVVSSSSPSDSKPRRAVNTTENPQPATKVDNKAPWAAATAQTQPILTLKEIQRIESERLEKQRQLDQEMKLEQQQKQIQEERVKEEQREHNEKFGLPSSSSWATSFNPQPKVTKTLAEIQKEEREAAELAKSQKQQVSTPSLADTISSSHAAVNEKQGWTTIVGKKAVSSKKQPTVNHSSSSSGARLNPQVLRSVSATTVPVTDNASLVREEILVWARSQMTNLYPSVSPNDLLEMFITLPSNQDSQQLISETIYSSSTTMNGRRFAQEFLKRRQKVDQLIGQSDPAAWSSAIIHSADKVAEVDEDGWSTSVKSKKKGKKY